VIIREAGHDELNTVKQIIHDSFKEYTGILHPPSGALRETVDSIQKRIDDGGGAIVALVDGEAVGAALYEYKEQFMYIGRVAVLPRFRGRGIGKAIVLYLENLAKAAGCLTTRIEVRLSLPGNLTMYQRLQYIPIEEHEYPDKTDRWYIMSKRI
jgi:ribosomal protein S18 acetylase RimI-like enzyme